MSAGRWVASEYSGVAEIHLEHRHSVAVPEALLPAGNRQKVIRITERQVNNGNVKRIRMAHGKGGSQVPKGKTPHSAALGPTAQTASLWPVRHQASRVEVPPC
jgi:hypothetical protein